MSKEEYKNLLAKKKARTKYNVSKDAKKRHGYDSDLEKCVADQIQWKLKAGEYTDVVEQFPFMQYVNGVYITKNVIDFKCTLKDGRIAFVEAKGFATDAWKIKRKLNIALLTKSFPNCEYWIVKGNCKYLKWEQVKLK